MGIDRDAVLHVARLARLNVQDQDLDALAEELSGILDYVAQLPEEEEGSLQGTEKGLGRREDLCHSPSASKLLELSAGHRGDFVHVPKVVDNDD